MVSHASQEVGVKSVCVLHVCASVFVSVGLSILACPSRTVMIQCSREHCPLWKSRWRAERLFCQGHAIVAKNTVIAMRCSRRAHELTVPGHNVYCIWLFLTKTNLIMVLYGTYVLGTFVLKSSASS